MYKYKLHEISMEYQNAINNHSIQLGGGDTHRRMSEAID